VRKIEQIIGREFISIEHANFQFPDILTMTMDVKIQQKKRKDN